MFIARNGQHPQVDHPIITEEDKVISAAIRGQQRCQEGPHNGEKGEERGVVQQRHGRIDQRQSNKNRKSERRRQQRIDVVRTKGREVDNADAATDQG